MEIIGPIFWLIVALGLLVTFQRVRGTIGWPAAVVCAFCDSLVGFGQALWSRTAKDGT